MILMLLIDFHLLKSTAILSQTMLEFYKGLCLVRCELLQFEDFEYLNTYQMKVSFITK